MPPVSAWLIAIVVVVFAILVIVLSRRRERARTEALRRVAETAGMGFQPEVELTAIRAQGDVQLFQRGRSRRVTNLMTGRVDGEQVAVFDYRYTTGSGKNQHKHSQTVVLLPSARPSLPDLHMAPENPLYRIAEMFGYQDIDIDSSPEFSRRYVVKGADEAAVRAALYPGATSYFAEHEGWTVDARSGTVAVYRANHRPKAEEMQAFVAEALTAVRSF